ncbi:helix-turn-helix transcriptional regulator [Mycobacterium sp. UM_CSW]|uniref:helix-turn-helix transcriptional regulator n=1 Tax=Mycobacterium sp. UM_CSW TaxID=1370119 RepID=UPI0003FAB2BF|nr:helix-turn-helix transcriptional regulator [Mycobacterium sp. UM_CSW]
MSLIDRDAERVQLDDVLATVRSGHSAVLVLRGEPGVGKSALLDYLAARARDCSVVRAAGVESEMELAHAALYQLCRPLLNRLDNLPVNQRDALRVAFGLTQGPVPDRLLIGIAVLSLFAEAVDDQPVVCLIDDVQWLDDASAQALAFVARRLAAESVAMVMATRSALPAMAELPTVEITGLPESSARELLSRVWTTPLDERVRQQFLAESHGNPLAIMELAHGLGTRGLVGGFRMPTALRPSGRVEESFRHRLSALPEGTRQLLLIAAAEPTGDPTLLWRAAARLGIGSGAAAPAVSGGLIEVEDRVRFRHPLVRSAIYRSTGSAELRRVHKALAEVTDPGSDPDRRAWHLAEAAEGPDEEVAAELERSADRAQARGGLAAAAAFLERSTSLTTDAALFAGRALGAASANALAGSFDTAKDLLAAAEQGVLTDHQRARLDLVRAQLAYVTGRGSDAPPLLLKAAKRLESIDRTLSRATYLEAMSAAIFAGRLAAGGGVLDTARAVAQLPRVTSPDLSDLLLQGLATFFIEGNTAALPTLRRAVDTARRGTSHPEQLRCLWQVGITALHIWDDESWEVLSTRHVELSRATGILTELPLALSSRAVMHLFAGELDAAESLAHEIRMVTQATGSALSPYGAIGLAAFRADRDELAELAGQATKDAIVRGEGIGLLVTEWANAVLNNGLGDYGQASAACRRAAEEHVFGGVSSWVASEFVEAAVHTGDSESAAKAFARLDETTAVSGTDWALGIQARSRALLSAHDIAEPLYREAVQRLGRTRLRAELARAHLVYGEWLRRTRRRTDARAQLQTAYDMFDAMGMRGFAERARRELLAAGQITHKIVTDSSAHLTPQEAQVAWLAKDGLTNPEIGERLFISARTVQYHLKNVFTKLGISSRHQLAHALASNRGRLGRQPT